MKIAQYYENDQIRLGLIDSGSLRPLSFKGDMIDLIRTRPDITFTNDPLPLEGITYAPAVGYPSKIIAIGLNYLDHIRESKGKTPSNPIVFAKFPNTLTGHGSPITWYHGVTEKVDFEAELAVVIGKKVFRCSEEDVQEVIFGFTCANDVSARDLQFKDGQWVRGKSLDTFCPLGPWIVTRDEIPAPHTLGIRCLVNGVVMQESNTEMMIFKLPQLISFLSRYFTLLPGDVILTGTPHGVGAFRTPPVYLKDHDEVVIEIEKVGILSNPCRVL